MRSITKLTTLCLAAALLFIAGCKKDNPTSSLMLHIHTNIDSNEVEMDSVYPNPAGRNITLSRADLYISNIVLTKTDGSFVNVNGRVLVKMGTEEYMVGNIPVGQYKSISYKVGVDAANNHTTPSSHTGTDVLAPQTPSMHFGDNATGYIFLAVEGLVDGSASGTGTPTVPYSYHIGTDALLSSVSLPDHSVAPYNEVYDAREGGMMTVHLTADYAHLFDGIDMKTNTSTNTTDNISLATTLANNISHLFTYED